MVYRVAHITGSGSGLAICRWFNTSKKLDGAGSYESASHTGSERIDADAENKFTRQSTGRYGLEIFGSQASSGFQNTL
jgi:hypothetical protein